MGSHPSLPSSPSADAQALALALAPSPGPAGPGTTGSSQIQDFYFNLHQSARAPGQPAKSGTVPANSGCMVTPVIKEKSVGSGLFAKIKCDWGIQTSRPPSLGLACKMPSCICGVSALSRPLGLGGRILFQLKLYGHGYL